MRSSLLPRLHYVQVCNLSFLVCILHKCSSTEIADGEHDYFHVSRFTFFSHTPDDGGYGFNCLERDDGEGNVNWKGANYATLDRSWQEIGRTIRATAPNAIWVR